MPNPTLITFPPSLDSEFSRFLLTHYGVAYREERHGLIFSSVVTLRHGRTPRFPLLYDESIQLDTIKKMVANFEPLAVAERKLLAGADPTEAKRDWDLFHGKLGSASTVYAYYNLLPLRNVMEQVLSDGTPASEEAAVRRAYPAFALLLRLLLRLTSARAQSARSTIEDVMLLVDQRLADERPYLAGDRFGLSDMAFAIAAAPVVWPDQYGGSIPQYADLPPDLQSLISKMRQRPSGRHALGIYRDLRQPAH